jgi:hypothetical protein
MNTIKVRLTFTEGILGTCPNDEDVYKRYIVNKGRDLGADIPESLEISEIEALPVDEQIEKGMTVFPRTDDGKPFLYDYQIKGFFKDTCGMLKKVPGTKSSKVKAFKKEIDGLIFPMERQIVFENAELDVCQRPLRAQTMQGERVALAMSEEIKAGCSVTFSIKYFLPEQGDLIREWLDYGAFRGIGQWRNSGKGRFVWEEVKE